MKKRIFSTLISLAMLISLLPAHMSASAATLTDAQLHELANSWELSHSDDFTEANNTFANGKMQGGSCSNCIQRNSTYGYAYFRHVTAYADHNIKINKYIKGSYAIEFDMFLNNLGSYGSTNYSTYDFSNITGQAVFMGLVDAANGTSVAYGHALTLSGAQGANFSYATAKRFYGVEEIAEDAEEQATHFDVRMIVHDGKFLVSWKKNTDENYTTVMSKTFSADDYPSTAPYIVASMTTGYDNVKIYTAPDEIVSWYNDELILTQKYTNESDTTKAVPKHVYEYYTYHGMRRDDAGYIYNYYADYPEGAFIGDHGTEMALTGTAEDGDFAVKYDLFLNDRNTDLTVWNRTFNFGDTLMDTMATNNADDYFTLDVYENSGDVDLNKAGVQYKKLASGGLHRWESEKLVDDNGNAYILANARASKVYGVKATEGDGYTGTVGNDETHKYIQILQIVKNKTLYTYARWNDNTHWKSFGNPIEFTTENEYYATIRAQMALGFDNIEIYREPTPLGEDAIVKMDSLETMTFSYSENVTVVDEFNAATITNNGTTKVTVTGRGYNGKLVVKNELGTTVGEIYLTGNHKVRPGLNYFTGTDEAYDVETDSPFLDSASVSIADNPVIGSVNGSSKAIKISSATEATPYGTADLGTGIEGGRPYRIDYSVLGNVNETYWLRCNTTSSTYETFTNAISSTVWKNATVMSTAALTNLIFQLNGEANNPSYNLYVDNLSVIPAYKIQYVNEKDKEIEFSFYNVLSRDSISRLSQTTYKPDYNPNANYVINGTPVKYGEEYKLAYEDLRIVVKPNSNAVMFSGDNATVIVPEGDTYVIPWGYELLGFRAENFVKWCDADGNEYVPGTTVNTADVVGKTLYASSDASAYTRKPLNDSIVNFADDRYNNWLANYSVGSITKLTTYAEMNEKGASFAWEADSNASSYTLMYSKNADMSNAVEVSRTTNSATVYYLYANTDYYWQVKTNYSDGTSKTSDVWHFKTADIARMFSTISNLRDIGGMLTEDKQYRVKQGLAFRSGAVVYKAEQVVANLGIKSELSIRGAEDGNKWTSSLGEGVTYTRIDGTHTLAAAGTNNSYTSAYGQERLKEEIQFFANESNYPIWYHCSAGRDRTGLLSYMLETLLGVSEARAMQDYELSAFCTGGFDSSQAVSYRNTMVTFNNYINTGYEGDTFKDKMEAFCLDIGVTQAEIDSIRAILLEPSEFAEVEDYTVTEPSYDKEAVVNGETVTVTAAVTKNNADAQYDNATLVVGLYKKVGDVWVLDRAVTDSKALTVGAEVSLEKSISIPAEGEYKLKSFVWDFADMYSFCEARELN